MGWGEWLPPDRPFRKLHRRILLVQLLQKFLRGEEERMGEDDVIQQDICGDQWAPLMSEGNFQGPAGHSPPHSLASKGEFS